LRCRRDGAAHYRLHLGLPNEASVVDGASVSALVAGTAVSCALSPIPRVTDVCVDGLGKEAPLSGDHTHQLTTGRRRLSDQYLKQWHALCAHKLMETIASGADGPTAFSPRLVCSFPTQLAVCRITLKRINLVSRHARRDARHIDGKGLSVNHHERLTHK
jgi:hypothetical protein